MIAEIKKRDGRIEPFIAQKIASAIGAAMEQTGELDEALAWGIAEEIERLDDDILDVETIQDLVEIKLMESSLKRTAKEYITYRNTRSKERERNSELSKQIEKILFGVNVQNSNANIDELSFSGKKFESANVIHKNIALRRFMRPDIEKACNEHLIYQHDLSEYGIGNHNCLFVDLPHLLHNGFSTRNGDVRAANSFSTACQLVAVIFQCQSQVQFGGVASAHIDYDLAPFVKRSFAKHLRDGMIWCEDITEPNVPNSVSISDIDLQNAHPKAWEYAVSMMNKEGSQAAQGLYHNLNTLESRAGSQVPFSSINFGTDTSAEGRLVTRWLLEASLSGIGKHNLTSIFPISIFKYKRGINDKPDTPNYDLRQLAEKSLSKRIYPNILNCDYSQNQETPGAPDTEVATMGCRTMLGRDRHGLGYSKIGRGNVCPVTMNLPKIGIRHGICLGQREAADIEGFWKELDDTLYIAETAVLDRFYHICAQSVEAATFMYQNGTIADYEKAAKDGIYHSMKHGTLSIGYIGIAEMCQALFGKDHSEDNEVHQFALSVVRHIYEWTKGASERNDLNFSCYATPAESLCKTFAQALKDEFGVIPKISDRDYITNSHHVPVWQKISIKKKIDTEVPFCQYATAGNILYVELESSIMGNQEAISGIIDYAMAVGVPYLAFNFPIDSCLECGLQGEIDDSCPRCENENIQRLRRVTGYLTSDYRRFNKGKVAECLDRVKHSKYTSFDRRMN